MENLKKTGAAETTLTFIKEKETKNTYRYQEVKKDGKFIIGPLYIQKSFLEDRNTPEIKITIHKNMNDIYQHK